MPMNNMSSQLILKEWSLMVITKMALFDGPNKFRYRAVLDIKMTYNVKTFRKALVLVTP